MSPRRLKSGFARLDVTRKWILLSCAIVALSAVLPWYEDLDAFGAGDRYLGLTGPLFLVGLMVLASALFIGAWIFLPAAGKRLPNLPVKEGALFVFLGLQDLLLLLVANSVFFHPKFGVNITLKNTRFGMILAFAGVVVMIWSSYRLYKREDRRYPSLSDEPQEPLIKMPEPTALHHPTPRISTFRPHERTERPSERESMLDSPDEGHENEPQPLRMDL